MKKHLLKHILSTTLFLLFLFPNISFSQITIDGVFTDWASVPVFASNGGVTMKVTHSGDDLFMYLSGTNLNQTNNIYINSDCDTGTGYNEGPWINNGQGGDILVQGASFYSSTFTSSNGGWGWNFIGSGIPFAATPTEIEFSVDMSLFNIPATCAELSIGAQITDNGVAVNLPDPGAFENPFATYSLLGPLPIELTSFGGKAMDYNSNELTWTTATEIDNDYFSIQKSRDGISWENVADMNGQGNSELTQYYKWIDANPFEMSYYRLKQVDFSGDFIISSTITIYNNIRSNEVTISPNPTAGNVTIEANVNQENIRLYDQIGRDLTNKIRFENLSDKSINLNLYMISNGLYYLRIGNSSYPIQVIR